MAVRFDASTDNYTRTWSLGVLSQWSCAFWGKVSVDRNTWSTFLSIDDTTTNDYNVLQVDSDGTSFGYWVAGGFHTGTATPIALTVGTWYFIGCSVNGASGTLVVQALSAASPTVVTWTTGQAISNATTLRLGDDMAAEWLNGAMAAVKIWTGATLTQAELQNEMWSYIPKRTANLKAWYPLLSPSTVDYSGNGQTLSGGSGTTKEDGPGIGWGQTHSRIEIKDTITVAVGQATSTETAGVILHQHTVGMALETSTARSTKIEVIVDTSTEINLAAEIVDPIAIGVTPLTASSAAASAQSWSTASVAPTGNRLILLCVAWAASTAVVANPIASVTGNGLTWVLLRGQNYGAATGTINARHRMEVWRALGPAPTAGAITITHAAAQPGINRCWSVFEVNSTDLSGTSGSGAIRQNAVNLGTAVTTATATLGAFGSTANATFGFGAGGSAMTIGAGFTAIATQLVSTPAPAVSLITEWFLGVDTTVNASQTTATQFGIIGWEIKRRFVEPLTGPPAETDLAQAITQRKTKTLGMALETDLSRLLVVIRTKAIGQASLTNAAQVIVRPPKIGVVGQVLGSHTAQSVTARKTAPISQAVLTDTAQAVTRVKLRALGQATSSETARGATALKAKLVGQALATGSARAVASLKVKALGMASLTNAAQAFGKLKTLAVGLVTGTHTAQAISRLKTVGVARSTDTQTAQALTRVKLRALGQATSTALAQALTRLKTRALGLATGTDLARQLSTAKALAVGRASGTDAARILTAVYVKALSRASETEMARSLTAAKALFTGRASELSTAQGLSRLKTLALGMATSAELARVLGLERGIVQAVEPNHAGDVTSQPALSAAVGRAMGADAAQPVASVFTKVVAIGQVTITNTAQGLTPLRLVPVTMAVESSTAQTIRRLLVEQATETDTALTVVFSRPGVVVLTSAASGPAQLRIEQAGAVLSSGPVASVQTSVEHAEVELTIERRGGVQFSEEA